ncbi:MAG: FAD-binding protein [Rhodospirillaceae bacterium]|nr:FAD-binding protein [Rhodospirillaceae bacterium]
MSNMFDVVVMGAGTAGLPLAIFAADRGAKVCLIERGPEVGGCLLINRGQMSGAGTQLQKQRGIDDSPAKHLDDVIRISKGTTDRAFAAMAVDLQGPFIDWLMENGFEILDDMPRIIHGHEAYDIPRTYWGREDGRSILKVLKPMLDKHVAAGRVVVKLHTSVRSLIKSESGAVIGVETDTNNERILARSVVLSSGGYGANPALHSKIHPGKTLWSGSYHLAHGRGLELGLGVGGVLVHADKFLPGFGGILDHTLAVPRYRSMGGLTPQDRPQWEVVVNARGQRFYAEDCGSVDQRAHDLAQQPDGRAWVIFDETIKREAPNLFYYFNREKTDDFYKRNKGVVSAATLQDLAAACGIDAPGLGKTIADYNVAVGTGKDSLGRTFMPKKIENGPFYAVAIFSYTVRSVGGLKVDTGFRVLDQNGSAIPGLYAVGEILGSMISGAGAVGGMSLTPALVFGRLLGEKLLPI